MAVGGRGGWQDQVLGAWNWCHDNRVWLVGRTTRPRWPTPVSPLGELMDMLDPPTLEVGCRVSASPSSLPLRRRIAWRGV